MDRQHTTRRTIFAWRHCGIWQKLKTNKTNSNTANLPAKQPIAHAITFTGNVKQQQQQKCKFLLADSGCQEGPPPVMSPSKVFTFFFLPPQIIDGEWGDWIMFAFVTCVCMGVCVCGVVTTTITSAESQNPHALPWDFGSQVMKCTFKQNFLHTLGQLMSWLAWRSAFYPVVAVFVESH